MTNVSDLHAEYQRIIERLDQPMTDVERDAVRASIVALFHETESEINELSAFKESIRELIARFKTANPQHAPARPPVPPAAASIRHDHIGASSHIERGWSALAAARWPDAELHLRRAVALDGTSATAHALLAWALVYRGREDDALGLCQEALSREAGHGLAHVVIGVICLRKGIVGEAIEHLSRIAAAPGDPRAVLYANYWLGVAYLDREMPAEAEGLLRKAVTLGPNLAEGWLELGHALWRRNQIADARDAWQRGATIQHSPHAVTCRQQLEAIATGGKPLRSPAY